MIDLCSFLNMCTFGCQLYPFHFPFSSSDCCSQEQPDDDPDKLSNRVFQFDPEKDRWRECAKMKYSRYRCGSAELNGEIYISGQTAHCLCHLNKCCRSKMDLCCVHAVFFRGHRVCWRGSRSVPSLPELCGDL